VFSQEDPVKTVLTLLIIAALIVGATWVITDKLRTTVSDHNKRIAQLEQRSRFVSHTVTIQNLGQLTAPTAIWTVEDVSVRIDFAWLYVEHVGAQQIDKSVMLSPGGDIAKGNKAKATVVVRESAPTAGGCFLKFWLQGNQIMLDPPECPTGIENFAAIEAAVQVR